MTEPVRVDCAYCGRMMLLADIEVRNDKLVCKDIEACDQADADRLDGLDPDDQEDNPQEGTRHDQHQ